MKDEITHYSHNLKTPGTIVLHDTETCAVGEILDSLLKLKSIVYENILELRAFRCIILVK